jgi:hypothetical protein
MLGFFLSRGAAMAGNWILPTVLAFGCIGKWLPTQVSLCVVIKKTFSVQVQSS